MMQFCKEFNERTQAYGPDQQTLTDWPNSAQGGSARTRSSVDVLDVLDDGFLFVWVDCGVVEHRHALRTGEHGFPNVVRARGVNGGRVGAVTQRATLCGEVVALSAVGAE